LRKPSRDRLFGVNFFLEGITAVAQRAVETSRKINALREKDMAKIYALGSRRAKSGMEVLRNLYKLPIVNVGKIEEWTGLSRQSANTLAAEFMRIGVLEQRDRKTTYGREFEYKNYLKLFTEE
jgi:hypothetical protein